MTTHNRDSEVGGPTRFHSGGGRLAVGLLTGAVLAGAVAVSSARSDARAVASNVVYISTNNPLAGQNSVLAYHRDPATGAVTLLDNYPTRGTGFFNADERLGPDDSDQELITSPDRTLLFTVNSGSDTVAVFNINPDGSLTHVNGSPFPSGGIQPVSLGLAGNQLYVVNKGDLEPGQSGGALPNYTGFRVSGSGHLSPIPQSTFEVVAGSHPTQALVAPGGQLLFGVDLFSFPFVVPPGFPPFVPPFATALQSFRILPNGRLAQGGNTPQPSPLPPPFPPFILGLQVHPTAPLLYAGFVLGGALGTYQYDAGGRLTLLNIAPSSGLGICWIEVNKQGTYAYTSNSTDDSVSVYSLADPYHPVEIQKVDLKGPKSPLCPPGQLCAPVIFTTTPFQLELDPAANFLYVLNHETTFDDSFPQGNALHILRVAPNGTLTEIQSSPVVLPQSAVPANAHPKGVIVF